MGERIIRLDIGEWIAQTERHPLCALIDWTDEAHVRAARYYAAGLRPGAALARVFLRSILDRIRRQRRAPLN